MSVCSAISSTEARWSGATLVGSSSESLGFARVSRSAFSTSSERFTVGHPHAQHFEVAGEAFVDVIGHGSAFRRSWDTLRDLLQSGYRTTGTPGEGEEGEPSGR